MTVQPSKLSTRVRKLEPGGNPRKQTASQRWKALKDAGVFQARDIPKQLPSKKSLWVLPRRYKVRVSSYHRSRLLNQFGGNERIMLLFIYLYFELIPGSWDNGGVYSGGILKRLHMNRDQSSISFALRLLGSFNVHVKTSNQVRKRSGGKSEESRTILESIQCPKSITDAAEKLLDPQCCAEAKRTTWLVHGGAYFNGGVEGDLDAPMHVTETAASLIKVLAANDGDSKPILKIIPHLASENVRFRRENLIAEAAMRSNSWNLLRMLTFPHQEYFHSPKSSRINGDSFNMFTRELRHELEECLGWTVCDLSSCGVTIFSQLYGCSDVMKACLSNAGLWKTIMDAAQLPYELKESVKDVVTPLLYGGSLCYLIQEFEKLHGNSAAQRLKHTAIIQNLGTAVEDALEKIEIDGYIRYLGGEKCMVADTRGKSSALSYQIHSYEIEYAGTIALELENSIPGSLRAFLHDGFSLQQDRDKEEFLELYEGANEKASFKTGLTIRSDITWPVPPLTDAG